MSLILSTPPKGTSTISYLMLKDFNLHTVYLFKKQFTNYSSCWVVFSRYEYRPSSTLQGWKHPLSVLPITAATEATGHMKCD